MGGKAVRANLDSEDDERAAQRGTLQSDEGGTITMSTCALRPSRRADAAAGHAVAYVSVVKTEISADGTSSWDAVAFACGVRA